MLYTYDETTSGAKRIDWSLNCLDWTKEEDAEFLALIKKFLAKRPFANDIQDIDFMVEAYVTGKWHDEYPDYRGVGEEYDLNEIELSESDVTVKFRKNQINNLYRFVNANRHRNKDLLEIVDVLRKSAKCQLIYQKKK